MSQDDNIEDLLELTDDESLEEKEGKVDLNPCVESINFSHGGKSEPCERLIRSP